MLYMSTRQSSREFTLFLKTFLLLFKEFFWYSCWFLNIYIFLMCLKLYSMVNFLAYDWFFVGYFGYVVYHVSCGSGLSCGGV